MSKIFQPTVEVVRFQKNDDLISTSTCGAVYDCISCYNAAVQCGGTYSCDTYATRGCTTNTNW